MGSPTRSTGVLGSLAVLFIILLPLAYSVVANQAPSGRGDDPPVPAANQPYVTSTDPSDGDVGVLLWSWITITFSRSMNASNAVFPLDPPTTALTTSWHNSNRTLILMHDEYFRPCTTYRIFVDGADLEGQGVLMTPQTPGPPNPWTFTTECSVFTITRTDPADNQTEVVVNGAYQNLVVWFSRPANPTALQVTLSPAVPLVPDWSNGNTKVTLRHADWFYDCTWNSVTVSASDAAGNPLTNVSGSPPNPWRFETKCVPPEIIRTNPANAAAEVSLDAPIAVAFNKVMDTESVSWSVLPAGWSFSPNWSTDHRALTLDHETPFPLRTMWNVTIGGRDLNGADLVPGPVPNPWSFTTTGRLSPPGGLQVARESPDIVVTWRPVIGATSYAVYSSSDRAAPWPWPKLSDTGSPRYLHAGAGSDGASHYYVVRAFEPVAGESANSTMGVKTVLPFWFSPFQSNVHWLSLPYRSTYRRAGDITAELTSSKVDVVAGWNPTTQTPVLWYFLRGAWRGTNFSIAPGDGFYIGVIATFSWVITGTDGLVPRSFVAPLSPEPGVDWLALPYTSSYDRVSDVVRGIEGDTGPSANSRIIEVGTWDRIAQRLVTFGWTPAGWSGQDFRIGSGTCVYLRIVTDFTWSPELITPEMP